MRRLKKSFFKGGAAGLVLLLAVIRCVFPSVEETEEVKLVTKDALSEQVAQNEAAQDYESAQQMNSDSSAVDDKQSTADNRMPHNTKAARQSEPLPWIGDAPVFVNADGQRVKRRIRGVSSYKVAFPDLQDVQVVAARNWGVQPVANRKQAEKRMSELVFIGSNPYYSIDKKMTSSIPYLVPRAADLLQTIARNFLDSLAAKQLPAHRIVVSSVLRTEEDVARLRRRNGNASEESCHRFGTTFDISHRLFSVVSPPGEERRQVRDDTLKYVLSEVLNDVRRSGRCYVKHEVRQPCFHITVR